MLVYSESIWPPHLRAARAILHLPVGWSLTTRAQRPMPAACNEDGACLGKIRAAARKAMLLATIMAANPPAAKWEQRQASGMLLPQRATSYYSPSASTLRKAPRMRRRSPYRDAEPTPGGPFAFSSAASYVGQRKPRLLSRNISLFLLNRAIFRNSEGNNRNGNRYCLTYFGLRDRFRRCVVGVAKPRVRCGAVARIC